MLSCLSSASDGVGMFILERLLARLVMNNTHGYYLTQKAAEVYSEDSDFLPRCHISSWLLSFFFTMDEMTQEESYKLMKSLTESTTMPASQLVLDVL